ncbi:hypothetical protein DL546_003561 [Coniochaeta pulveracea]|uniref:Uncharacterized protein n=1 Tax=Coniochaeta pulveracea TaxID=177199 RepID=A0A420Y6G8_9PEZI|nr:hypothetical protein DL546_003561 [Coniochaeta pulveracea]
MMAVWNAVCQTEPEAEEDESDSKYSPYSPNQSRPTWPTQAALLHLRHTHCRVSTSKAVFPPGHRATGLFRIQTQAPEIFRWHQSKQALSQTDSIYLSIHYRGQMKQPTHIPNTPTTARGAGFLRKAPVKQSQ